MDQNPGPVEDPLVDAVIPLIRIIEAVAELAAIEGFDPVVSKLEEAVEELEKTMDRSPHVRQTSTQQ